MRCWGKFVWPAYLKSRQDSFYIKCPRHKSTSAVRFTLYKGDKCIVYLYLLNTMRTVSPFSHLVTTGRGHTVSRSLSVMFSHRPRSSLRDVYQEKWKLIQICKLNKSLDKILILFIYFQIYKYSKNYIHIINIKLYSNFYYALFNISPTEISHRRRAVEGVRQTGGSFLPPSANLPALHLEH